MSPMSIIAVGVVWCALPSTANAVADAPTKDDIRQGVLAQRELLTHVALEWEARTYSNSEDAVAFAHERFVVSGPRVSWTCTLGGHVDGSGPLVTDACTFGLPAEDSMTYQSVTRSATIAADDYAFERFHKDMTASEFFGAMSWFPTMNRDTVEANRHDLAMVIDDPNVTIDSSLVDVGDWRCVVLDSPADSGKLRMQFWLAVDQGFVPVRRTLYGADGTPFMTNEATALRQLANGAWLVEAGVRTIDASCVAAGPLAGSTFEFHLLPGDDGASTNVDMAAEFGTTQNLPAGTRVFANGAIMVTDAGAGGPPSSTAIAASDAGNSRGDGRFSVATVLSAIVAAALSSSLWLNMRGKSY
jgi:hypothetical protein